jgi:hypothetical protein
MSYFISKDTFLGSKHFFYISNIILQSIDNCSLNTAVPFKIYFLYLTSANFYPLFQIIDMVQGNFKASFNVFINATKPNLNTF